MVKPPVLLLCLAVVFLAGCGIDPGNKSFPAVMRAPEPPVKPSEAPPDMRAILKSDLSSIFLPSAQPKGISFSPPKPDLGDWTSCIRATVNGAMGNSIGRQTFMVTLMHGKVIRQEHVDTSHWCTAEPYEAL